MKHFLTLILSAAVCASAWGARDVRSINDGWSFRLPSDSVWTTVNLPHNYSLDAYSTRHYYKGKGFYSKVLRIDSLDTSRRYFIRFDAAGKAADVSVNGKELGTHRGGYTAFAYDITPLLRQGDNMVEVTTDNDHDDIPPLSADFTFFGGLYRDAWLITTPLQHFDVLDHAAPGIRVKPHDVSEVQAGVSVVSRLVNEENRDRQVILKLVLTDAGGKVVGEKIKKMKLKAKQTLAVDEELPVVKSPSLWSPDSPYLYTLSATVSSPNSSEILDSQTAHVGFRWFSFDGAKGFHLNGKPLKLRGFNRHQDMAPLGNAISDDAHRRDMELLKDFGCNFVRLAHYPQDDAALEACDRLGLLVWEEIPVVNNVPALDGFDDTAAANLTEMIRQHYNHPSVILWGYMNEILLRAPGDSSPQWPAARGRITSLASRLESLLKAEDPSRASVMAFHGTGRYNDVGLAITDVQGWNLYQGWYGGDLSGFEKYLENQRSLYPERSLIVSEWGAGSDRRLHSQSPVPFDFSIEYQQKYVEHYLPYIENNDYISGSAYWNFIDFNVGERQESMPRVNNKGLFYNDRSPKDVAYYFKAAWRDDVPVMRIATRDRDCFVGNPGDSVLIKVYSNCPEVTLALNGKDIATQPVTNNFAVFRISLPEGESHLLAHGAYLNEGAIDAATVRFIPEPKLAAGGKLSINVGSNCDYTSAHDGTAWLADREYTPGGWGHIGGKSRSTTSEIFNTADNPLFQTMLENPDEYRICAPAGTYEVELCFTDISRPGDNSPYLLGADAGSSDGEATTMGVEICGKMVERALTPSAEAGYQHAVIRRYIIDNPGDTITIRLSPIKGKALLAGISVRPL